MKKKFTFLIAAVMLLMMMILPGNAVGQTRTNYVINTSNFETINSGTGYTAYDGDHTINGITINSSNVMVQSSKLQFKKSVNAALYNKTAIPGVITKITLATATNFTIYVGTTQNPSTTTVTSGSTISSGSYTYFKVVNATSSTATTATITVEYTPTHTITYSATNGSIDGVLYGTSTPVASGGAVAEGGQVSLNATPNDGYIFTSWSVSGAGATLSSTNVSLTTFTMGTANATVTANFTTAPEYTITAQSNNNSYGTVSLSGTTITATPAEGYRVSTSDPYSVSPTNSATVSQNGNTFTVTPSANTTVTINFEAIPTHTATFSVNGDTSSDDFAEGATITFPSNPSDIQGKVFRGWVTDAIDEPTDDEPSYVNTANQTMGENNVTYYAVFATATSGIPVETNSQTLQYDTWTYYGTTTDKKSYRLFGNGSYIVSSAFDLSKLSKVIVSGGSFGGGSYNSLTIGDGSSVWKSVTVSTSGGIGNDTITGGTPLTGTNALRVISTCGDGSSNGVRISKVEIWTMETPYTYSDYCTDIDLFTITAVSNNDNYGTVSLSGEVITGSPKSGYRYASPAYTVTSGTATVSQSGNAFTVTPSSNCTVCINFELIPTYTLGWAVSPADAGTVTLSALSGLEEGATVTATAAADAGYKFKNWSISGTGASLSDPTANSTTVTIGTANATVTANFDPVTTYAITYSVNGVTNTVNVEENASVDLSAPESAKIPVGYVFKGWRTSVIATPTDTAPTDYVTSATSTGNQTYYAVMAIDNVSDITTHLTGDEIATNFAATAMSYSDSEKTYNDTGESMTWGARCITAQDCHRIQLKSDDNVYIKAVAPHNITAVKLTISNASNTSGGADDITKHGDFSGTVKLGTTIDKDDASCGSASSSAIVNNILTISANGTSNTIYIHVNAGARIWNVDVTYLSINSTNFCTSVSSVTMTKDVTIAGDLNVTYTLTVPSGKKLTVNGTLTNGTAANLIIKDGGQLKFYDNGAKDGVQATVEKNISAWENVSPADGWYFIASPINRNDLAPTAVNNMITDDISNDDESTPRTYDLYGYNATANSWINYRGHSNDFVLANGHGYLYANESNQTLAFAGAIKPYDAGYTIPVTEGWNLVGNPYTFNAYANRRYYKIDPSSTIIEPVADNEAVPPCTGIIVNTEDSGASVTFTDTQSGTSYVNQGNLQMVLAQNVATRGEGTAQTLDKAIVSFNEGSQLGKFYFGTQDANLYIPMNNEEYAVVSSSAQGEMPVNFKAHRDGQYTITVNPQEVEMGYLHLIDNIGGKDIDLLATPSYTFNAKADDYESRFRLVFSANMVNADLNDDFAFFSNGQLVIANEGEAILQVIDVTGRVVATESVNGTCSKAVNVKAGVYVLRLINGTDVKTQKIIVK